MAKHYINFDEKVYGINKEVLAPVTDALKAHLGTLGSGGTLEYDKEVQFKAVIDEADIKAFIGQVEGDAQQGITIYDMIEIDSSNTDEVLITEIPLGEDNTAYGIMVTDHFGLGHDVSAVYYLNALPMGFADGWYKQDMTSGTPVHTTMDEPPTIIIPKGATVNPDLKTISVFFDLDGSSGDLDITLDGAVYKVDSAKLAPATNSLVAHLETLKGGGSGLVEGETYTLKSEGLENIDPSGYMSFAFPMVQGSYGVAQLGNAYLLYALPEAVLQLMGVNEVNTDAWIYFNMSAGICYMYPFKTNVGVIGWIDKNTGEKITEPISATISPIDETLGLPTLDELAVFFDIPSAGGSNEVTETITADSDFLVEDIGLGSMYRISCPINDLSTDNISLGAQGKPIKIDDDIHFHLVFNNGAPAEDFYTNNIADDSELNIRLLEIVPALATAQYLVCAILVPNNIEEIFTSFGKPELFDRFKDVYAPNTILIPRYIFEEQDGVESPLETLTVTYSNGPSTGGDLAITINGAEHWVDSAKLADAKNALAAHLKALEQGSVNLITFTIDGTSYQAEEGMTWGEWVESEYNTIGARFANLTEGTGMQILVDDVWHWIVEERSNGWLIAVDEDFTIFADNVYIIDELTGTWVIDNKVWTKTFSDGSLRCEFTGSGGATFYAINSGEIIEQNLKCIDLYGTASTSSYYYIMQSNSTGAKPYYRNAGWLDSSNRACIISYYYPVSGDTEKASQFASSTNGQMFNTINIKAPSFRNVVLYGKQLTDWLKANATKQ